MDFLIRYEKHHFNILILASLHHVLTGETEQDRCGDSRKFGICFNGGRHGYIDASDFERQFGLQGFCLVPFEKVLCADGSQPEGCEHTSVWRVSKKFLAVQVLLHLL